MACPAPVAITTTGPTTVPPAPTPSCDHQDETVRFPVETSFDPRRPVMRVCQCLFEMPAYLEPSSTLSVLSVKF